MMRRARLDLEDDKVRGTGTSRRSGVDSRLDDKRTYRLYAEEGLSIRTKLPRRKRAWRHRQGRPAAAAPNEIWAMDFMPDQLFGGRPIRISTVVDIHTREGLTTRGRRWKAGAWTTTR